MCMHGCVCIHVFIEHPHVVIIMHVLPLLQGFDHKTNQPVAIKIIRNKKRFHHQALVEVKILDSLRKKVNFHMPCNK